MKNKLRAAEMWFYKRMLRISWRDRVTNEEVMGRLCVKEIRKRQVSFIAHIIRGEKTEHLCLTGRIEGRKSRETENMDSILGETGKLYDKSTNSSGW